MASTQSPLTSFEQAVGYIMHLWPALSLAVTQLWGGPDSSDKRDWFVGSICELFDSDPETDAEDVEYRLLQVMSDVFEVAVDDDSAWETAENIIRVRKACAEGDLQQVESWRERWQRRTRAGGSAVGFHRIEGGDEDQDTDASEDEEDGDVDMEDAPELVRVPREKLAPEVDDDGFTKVVSKKKR